MLDKKHFSHTSHRLFDENSFWESLRGPRVGFQFFLDLPIFKNKLHSANTKYAQNSFLLSTKNKNIIFCPKIQYEQNLVIMGKTFNIEDHDRFMSVYV